MNIVLGGVTGGIGSMLVQEFNREEVMPYTYAMGRAACDIEHEGSVDDFFSELNPLASEVNIINAAGVSISSMLHKSLNEDVIRTFRVNVFSNIWILKHARQLWKTHGGSLTILSSVTVDTAPIGTGVYSASKASLRSLVKTAAKEIAPFARVNLLELGYSDMGMIKQVPDIEKVIESIPMKRLATIEDIHLACKYLIESTYTTGSILKLNGGLSS